MGCFFFFLLFLLPSFQTGRLAVEMLLCVFFFFFSFSFFFYMCVRLKKACPLLKVVLLPQGHAVELIQGHTENSLEVLWRKVSLERRNTVIDICIQLFNLYSSRLRFIIFFSWKTWEQETSANKYNTTKRWLKQQCQQQSWKTSDNKHLKSPSGMQKCSWRADGSSFHFKTCIISEPQICLLSRPLWYMEKFSNVINSSKANHSNLKPMWAIAFPRQSTKTASVLL